MLRSLRANLVVLGALPVAMALALAAASIPSRSDYVPNLRSPAMDAPPVNDLVINGIGPNTIKRALSGVLADFPVYPQWYGAKCDGSTDDRAAYQKALDAAKASGRPVFIGGRDLCVIGGSLYVKGSQSLTGGGQARSFLVATFNGPIFVWDTNGPLGVSDAAEVSNSVVTGFTLRGQFAPGAAYSNSRGFQFGGGSANFFQYNRFRGLAFESLYAAFDMQKGTRATSFGQESNAAWLGFDDITIRSGSRDAVYGWIWNYGSGTGTTYSDIKTALAGPGSSVFWYKAGVVGDVVITGGHFGGATGSNLIRVDGPTSYRTNILVSGSQLDAGMTVPFDFTPNAPAFARISFTGNNLGGGVALAYPPLSNSLIDDQEADERRAGRVVVPGEIPGLGSQTRPLFSVALDGLNPYTGTSCTVVVSGLVAGIGGGVTQATFLLGRSSGDPNVVPVGAQASTVTFPQFYVIAATPVANTGRVTISAAFAPTASGSQLDAQIRCIGGTYSVARL